MPSPPLQVSIRSMTSVLELNVAPNSTGSDLFTEVLKHLRIRETWYFGLHYIDSKNVPSWLKLDKKISKNDFREKSSQRITLLFRARLFPEEVSTDLIEDVTQEFFYLQVKEAILNDEIYCPAETAVLLASFAMQAKYGDFDEDTYLKTPPGNERLLSRGVMGQYRLSTEEWEKRIVNWWKEHQGMFKEDARLEYLKVAQDLEMYGVHYYEIRNKRGTELYLGVDALGINIYDRKDKLTPKIGFPWSEIGNLLYEKKKFIVKPAIPKAPTFVFYVERRRINRQILSLCRANHALYMRRRQPDKQDIIEMKRQAELKQAQRRRVFEEEKLRKKQEQEEENRRRTQENSIDHLERTVSNILSGNPGESNSLSSRRSASLSERSNSIVGKMDQVEYEKKLTVESSRRLKNEEERIRSFESLDKTSQMAEDSAAEIQKKLEIAHEIEADLHQTSLRVINVQARNSNDSDSNQYEDPDIERNATDSDDASISNDQRHDLEIDIDAPRPEESRSPLTTRDQTIQQKVISIRKDLEKQQNVEQVTEDQIYRENIVDKGIDKYKTLKKIRQGTVKRRIDEFEAM